MNEIELKYGCNPNQKPSRIFMEDGSELPVTVLNGRPGYINFLDAFNGWQLVKELKEALEFQEFYLEKHDAEQIKLMDSRFHETLYKLTGSTAFYDTLVPLHKKIQKYRRASIENRSRAAASVAEHRKIFNAIEAQDAPLAAKCALEHVENAYKHIIRKD